MQTVVYIGNKLSASGYTPTTIEVLTPKLETLGVKVITASSRVNKVRRLIDMLLTIAGNKSADAVIMDTYSTSAFYFTYAAAMLCRFIGMKYIPILHGGNLPARFKRSPGLTKAVFSNSFINIAVSSYLEGLLKTHSYPHILIENNIDINEYSFEYRQQVAPNFIWVRSFDKIYNPEMAIRVFNIIYQQYPNAKLTMVGPDKDGSQQLCSTLVKRLQLNEAVSFTGKLSKKDWHQLASNNDIFINTSSFDNMPLSVIEAMALGLVIISTDAGGLPYFLKHEENALLSGINDEDAMAANIGRLLSGNVFAGTLSKSARQTAERCDWQIVKSKWLALLNTLSGEK